jgi:hypothetical protein
MDIHTFLAFIGAQRRDVMRKGWHDTTAEVTIKFSPNKMPFPDSATISPKHSDGQGNTNAPKGKEYLYYSASRMEEPYYTRDKAAAVPTVAEDQNAKLFEMIEKIKGLAEDAGMPEDFVNPILLLGEKLRTNILQAPVDTSAREELPF